MRIRRRYLPFGRPSFSEQEIRAATRVLRSGWIGMGPETIAFEKELERYLGVPHVVAVSSCTAALHLSLLVSDVRPGDEVICPSLTWCSTANAALYLGAKPVFCDIDPDTLCVTPASVRAKVSKRTKAVVIVHFGGLAVNPESIRTVLPEHTVVVEDAAHALGSRFSNGGQVGSSGNLTCFSFYANKNLSTAEGGAIAVSNDAMAQRLRSLRQHGMPVDAWKRFSCAKSLVCADLQDLGYKMNYTDLQACIGRIQLRRQQEFAAIRLAVAQCYVERLKRLDSHVRIQSSVLAFHHARHLFSVQLPLEEIRHSRDEVLKALRLRNVGAGVHYAPLHRMPLYGRQSALPNTERVCERILTLPISASMSVVDADYVMSHFCDLIR